MYTGLAAVIFVRATHFLSYIWRAGSSYIHWCKRCFLQIGSFGFALLSSVSRERFDILNGDPILHHTTVHHPTSHHRHLITAMVHHYDTSSHDDSSSLFEKLYSTIRSKFTISWCRYITGIVFWKVNNSLDIKLGLRSSYIDSYKTCCNRFKIQ